MIPLAISSQRVIPPKMLNRIAVDLLVGGDHLERVDDRLGLRAAAGVEEVRGLAAGLGDDVERRHAEAGAVGEDADVAAELDVGEALLLRHRLLRVLGGLVGELGELGVAEERVAVDRHLRVERDDLRGRAVTISGLTSIRVASSALRDVVELDQHLGDLVGDVVVDPGVDGDLAGARRRSKPSPGSMWRWTSASGSVSAISSTSIPPIRESIASSFFSRAVEDDRGVVLGVDLRRLLDPEVVDGEAADVHAEDRLGVLRAPRPRPWRP